MLFDLAGGLSARTNERESNTHLVQVPLARGKVIPEMDSIREDFPALCEPTTAIIGRSISDCTL